MVESGAYLARLAELARKARRPGGVVDRAATLLEAQRVAAWGLREAVTLARESGMSWRELAAELNVPAATLHRKYRAGGGLFWDGQAQARTEAATSTATADPAATPAPPDDGAVAGLPPRPLTTFVGRDRELADLPAMVRRHRLVTVTGPAGVGKTRLALELAHRLGRPFRGGVFWVPFAGVTGSADPQRIASAVTGALRCEPRRMSLDQALGVAASGGAVLLVLDNCEHIVAACAGFVQRVLAGHPALTVLTTSREPLDVPGELRVRLDPFPAVPLDPTDPWQAGSPAFRLFADRARLAAHDFVLVGHERVVAHMCNALDGLPLGIELAAKQCAILPVPVLPARPGHQLDLAVNQRGAVLGPHSSLRASIAWSYDLLDPVEQAMFRRLALLPDGATDTMAAVLSHGLGLDRAGRSAVLSRLVAKSMLTMNEIGAGGGRFTMLAATRAIGLEQLAAAGETAEVTELLLEWLTAQADALLDRAYIGGPGGHVEPTRAEVAVLLFAAQTARDSGDPRYPRLGNAAGRMAEWNGQLDIARREVELVLAAGDLSPVDEAYAHMAMSSMSRYRGDHAAAVPLARRAQRAAQRCGLRVQLQATEEFTMACNDPAQAIEIYAEQLDVLRAAGGDEFVPLMLNGLAWNLLLVGEVRDATAAAAEMLALKGEHLTAGQLRTMAMVALANGDPDTAAEHIVRGLDRTWTRTLRLVLAEAMALAAAAQGRPVRALRLFACCAALRERFGLSIEPWTEVRAAAARAAARDRLTPRQAAAAEAAGARLSIDELAGYARTDAWDESAREAPLTERETTVAILVARGFTTKQIAARLRLTPRTVTAHLANIRAKLGLANRVEVAAWVTLQHHDHVTGNP